MQKNVISDIDSKNIIATDIGKYFIFIVVDINLRVKKLELKV